MSGSGDITHLLLDASSREPRVSRFVRRRMLLVAGVVAVVVALAVALGFVARASQRARWSSYRNALAAAESALTMGRVDEARVRLDAAPASLRGWEWRHLHGRLVADVRTAPAGVSSSVTPRVVAGSFDERTMRIAFVTTAGTLVTLPLAARHPAFGRYFANEPSGVAWVGDGSAAIATSLDGQLVSTAAAGPLLRAPTALQALAADATGTLLAVARADSTMELRRWPSLAIVRSVRASFGQARHLAFSPDGRTLACACADGAVWLFPLDGSDPPRSVRAHEGGAYDVAFSPDGRTLATVGRGGAIRLWQVRTGRNVGNFVTTESVLAAVAFSADGTRLAAGGGDQVVTLFDLRRRSETVRLHGHASLVSWLAFAHHDSLLVSGSHDGTIRVWDAPAVHEP